MFWMDVSSHVPLSKQSLHFVFTRRRRRRSQGLNPHPLLTIDLLIKGIQMAYGIGSARKWIRDWSASSSESSPELTVSFDCSSLTGYSHWLIASTFAFIETTASSGGTRPLNRMLVVLHKSLLWSPDWMDLHVSCDSFFASRVFVGCLTETRLRHVGCRSNQRY